MEIWTYDNGLEIYENGGLFECYYDDVLIGKFFPSDDDLELCRKDLNDGVNPIEAGWEDGLGNILSYEGWEDVAWNVHK